MSTYGSTYSFLKRHCSRFHCSEFIPGHKSGEWIDGILNEDCQHLSFADDSLDIITSNHVFEHVPDDLAAYRECWRTLRPGGSLSFTVPLSDAGCTVQVATLKDGAIKWLSTPEFHSSRATGPNSVPVFWRFSVNDISERVAFSGFRQVSLVKVSILPQQAVPQIVIHAVK
jgi:SAM-dependent methyltransferase